MQAERDEALREAAAAMARPPEGEPDPLPRLAAKVKGTVATKATLQAMGEDSSALDAEIVELQEWLRRLRAELTFDEQGEGPPVPHGTAPGGPAAGIWMLAGLALKHLIKWSKPTVLDWISKYDLLAPQRSKDEFKIMCDCGVWGPDQTLWPKEHTALVATRPTAPDTPSFSSLSEAEAHKLLRCMLTAQEQYHARYPDATDWSDWGERLAAVGISLDGGGGGGATAEDDLSTLPEEPTFA